MGCEDESAGAESQGQPVKIVGRLSRVVQQDGGGPGLPGGMRVRLYTTSVFLAYSEVFLQKDAMFSTSNSVTN